MLAGLPSAARKRVMDNIAPATYWLDSGYLEAYDFDIIINPQEGHMLYCDVLARLDLDDVITIIAALIKEKEDGQVQDDN